MELTRPRKMELLHTPKLDLLRMMRDNSLKVEDVIVLFASNKLAPVDIRMNAPTICDKLLTMFLRQMAAKQETTISPPMAA
ncbi:MAG: hypothetical protein MOP49_69 [Nitrososphaera sp.]|nr:hypothetical protein [Nitrososphaera sp.]